MPCIRPCSFSAIRPSIHYMFSKSPRKCWFSVADDIRMNGGTYTHIDTHPHAHTCSHPRSHSQTCGWNYGKAAARCRWWAKGKRTQLHRLNIWDNRAAMARDNKKDTITQAHSNRHSDRKTRTHTRANVPLKWMTVRVPRCYGMHLTFGVTKVTRHKLREK